MADFLKHKCAVPRNLQALLPSLPLKHFLSSCLPSALQEMHQQLFTAVLLSKCSSWIDIDPSLRSSIGFTIQTSTKPGSAQGGDTSSCAENHILSRNSRSSSPIVLLARRLHKSSPVPVARYIDQLQFTFDLKRPVALTVTASSHA